MSHLPTLTTRRNFYFTMCALCNGRDCIEQKSNQNFGCNVNCEGIYADVQRIEDDRVEGYEKDTLQHKANKKLISKLVGEYNAYKKSKLLRFRFSSKASSTMFGKSELKSF